MVVAVRHEAHRPVVSRRHCLEKDNMNALVSRVKAFFRSEDGPTATEYAVLLALIIVVCITAISAVGTKANAAFDSVQNSM